MIPLLIDNDRYTEFSEKKSIASVVGEMKFIKTCNKKINEIKTQAMKDQVYSIKTMSLR